MPLAAQKKYRVQDHGGRRFDIFVGPGAQPWRMSGQKRLRAAVNSKASPGQPPLRPEAIVNLLAITFWVTLVLWPLATWVLNLV